ncbi:MAG: hypothetical protein CV045_00265 [Cyanobacteria bacterium M5B4]|nr:MAG: hypothetical protein CV045_00265 [Cyanobacteria bacterium M5B4]
MTVFDWLICGSGVTGAALGYELQRSGFRVGIIDRSPQPANATRFSYGGVPYWSGTTELMQTLCQEAIGRYPALSEELGDDIGFREIKLLLTLSPEDDRDAVAQSYHNCATVPQWCDRQTAVELEPLLNLEAISGAFVLDHAQVDPESLVRGYLQAFSRSGGTLIYETVIELLEQGVRTEHHSIGANGVILCAGGQGRRLLKRSGISFPLFFPMPN